MWFHDTFRVQLERNNNNSKFIIYNKCAQLGDHSPYLARGSYNKIPRSCAPLSLPLIPNSPVALLVVGGELS